MSANLALGVDVQTGAFSRARFESELSRAVSEAKRLKCSISILYADADDFLSHRDLHGDNRADEVLAWLAQQISEVADGRGPVGRIESDVFAVFLQGCALTDAMRLADDLRNRVGGVRHRGDSGPFRVTVSVGVASLRRNEPWGNLLEAAENACRKAKQGGRDRTARR